MKHVARTCKCPDNPIKSFAWDFVGQDGGHYLKNHPEVTRKDFIPKLIVRPELSLSLEERMRRRVAYLRGESDAQA